MSQYPQVPEWWYLCIFVSMFIFGIISIEIYPTQMPVWAFVLALVIAFVYIIPIGMIQAITNQQVGLNVITELVIGYALPGKPIAMMMFKTWGSIVRDLSRKWSLIHSANHILLCRLWHKRSRLPLISNSATT